MLRWMISASLRAGTTAATDGQEEGAASVAVSRSRSNQKPLWNNSRYSQIASGRKPNRIPAIMPSISCQISVLAEPAERILQAFRIRPRGIAQLALGLFGTEEHAIPRHAQGIGGEERFLAG